MAGGGVSRKVSAASARSHTRKLKNKKSSSSFLSGMFPKITVVLLMGILAWTYQSVVCPPPPKICGSPDGPSITAPRIKLRDGRHLAYKDHGAPKDTAKYKIIYVHGTGSSRHDAIALSRELVDEIGVYLVSIDRPGYGESDPHPERTPKSLPLDIEELADQLGLGSKFYVIGYSMGGQVIWGCLKYIPHRLAGAALVAPVVNYWWPGFPSELSEEAYKQQPPQDQWALRIARYTQWLTYWWNTQKWFNCASVISGNPNVFSRQDFEIFPKITGRHPHAGQAKQQGVHESVHRDMMVGFGKWEFDPMDLKNPFPNNEGSVHLWHGDDDRLVPVLLQRYIAEKLPWIHYHEIADAGHLLPFDEEISESIIKSVLFGEK